MTNKWITFVMCLWWNSAWFTYMQKRPFPSSLSHKAQFFMSPCGAFCPVSSLMGITHKALSFWTALWSLLSVLWLSSQSDLRSNEQMIRRRAGHFLFFSLFVRLLPLPDLSALSFFIFSPLLVFCVFSFRWPHQFVYTLCRQGRHSVDGQTSYIMHICLCAHWHLNNSN